jgi:hypothetical protein
MTEFVYRPRGGNSMIALNATPSVKFSQRIVMLDEWYLFGGTKWTRSLFRLRHPIIYSKRGLRNLYRRIRRVFIKDRTRLCRVRWKKDGVSKV